MPVRRIDDKSHKWSSRVNKFPNHKKKERRWVTAIPNIFTLKSSPRSRNTGRATPNKNRYQHNNNNNSTQDHRARADEKNRPSATGSFSILFYSLSPFSPLFYSMVRQRNQCHAPQPSFNEQWVPSSAWRASRIFQCYQMNKGKVGSSSDTGVPVTKDSQLWSDRASSSLFARLFFFYN